MADGADKEGIIVPFVGLEKNPRLQAKTLDDL
jgi:hypothetical protein